MSPRVCTICTHPQRSDIEKALIAGEPFRSIADRWSVSKTALIRHKEDHLPVRLIKAAEAKEVAQADDLLEQLRALRNKAMSLLLQAEKAGDIRTALAGVREARATIELLAEVEGELDRRAQVNILIDPSWLAVRTVLLNALQPYPDVRVAVAQQLAALEAGHAR